MTEQPLAEGRSAAGTPAPEPATEQPPAAESFAAESFADLERRPVAEHVAVFEAEHARLQRELSSIDQL